MKWDSKEDGRRIEGYEEMGVGGETGRQDVRKKGVEGKEAGKKERKRK